MRKQTDKKLISFSKLSLIDRFVKDEAEIENRSESAIIEAHLLESFLPKEKNARFWVENYLYSEDGGIGKTLEAIFSTNAAGVDWGAKYDNLLPIVEFAKTQECFCDTIPTGEEEKRNTIRARIRRKPYMPWPAKAFLPYLQEPHPSKCW